MDMTGQRILLVEDDPLLGRAVSLYLRAIGAEVDGPHVTVHSALKALSRTGYDAALLDFDLAGETTTPVAEALRDRSIHFVFYTGSRSAAAWLAEEFRAAVIDKPAPLEDVANALTTRAPRARSDLRPTSARHGRPMHARPPAETVQSRARDTAMLSSSRL